MEKLYTETKMSKVMLDSMLFEIIICKKGDGYRARSSSLAKISNSNDYRPEATSQISYENAIQKLIPKIENALSGTNKKLGRVFQDENGKIMYSIESNLYQNQTTPSVSENILNNNFINANNNNTNNAVSLLNSIIINALKNSINLPSTESIDFKQISIPSVNTIDINNSGTDNNVVKSEKIITFQFVIVKWQKSLLARTKKDYEDEDYFSPTTLESYSRNLRSRVFPYLEEHPEYDNVKLFSEQNVDEIFSNINCEETKRVLLVSLKLIFDFAVDNNYISSNPIADKKLKAKKKKKKKKKNEVDYDFIKEEDRAKYINCMIKEISSPRKKKTDAPLAFLFNLLHGPRPEETCGVRWIDLNFKEDDYHVQNAYKNIPIYDEETMKRIGWEKGDGPLKTPESYRHIGLDSLIKPLLIEHKKEQKEEFKKTGRKWSEYEYVFLNSDRMPFVPKVLSRNFTKFINKNKLPHIVLYGLRHAFATHCRNLGMKPEILAPLMGHTEYETTQRYYIHISSDQKKAELQKVQQQDLKNYLDEDNKHLIHLQNNITQYNKDVSNLNDVRKEDMLNYLQMNDETLKVLKEFIMKLNCQEKIVA